MVKISNAEYHADSRVCSSLLKAALTSKAHLERFLQGKGKKTDSMVLGTAIHCYFLERDRFNAEYNVTEERFQRASGVNKAGDLKLDEYGDPIRCVVSPEGDIIKGESAKKFFEMTTALDECEKAQELLKGAKTEVSLFTETERVRPDLITDDGWIVDLKTVSGTSEMPLEPAEFAREFWRFGYDLQMYMYDKVARECGIDSKGFIFLCIDAKIPSGVRIFYFPQGNEWFEYGKMRYEKAYNVLNEYRREKKGIKYEEVCIEGLPIPFSAIGALSDVEG